MNAQSELASTEARVFNAYWQDGVLDLLAGGAILLVGLGWLAGFMVIGTAVALPLALVSWPILRQRITHPRLGQVRFNAQRRFRVRYSTIAVMALGLGVFGVIAARVVTGQPSALPRWLAPGIPALLLAVLALSTAEVLGLVRFTLYAVAFVVSALVVSALDADPGWSIAAGGSIAAANGAWMLASFLRHFPPLATEMDR